MVEPAHFTATPRHRVALSLDLELLSWLDGHMQAGGLLGGPSHAAERAIQRLRTEFSFIQAGCKKGAASFQSKAFWELYTNEIAQSTPSGGGRARHGHASTRGRVFASIAIELIAWADMHCIKDGPFQSLSQIVEVGLRSLQHGDCRSEPGAFMEGMSRDASALWASYLKLAKAKAK